MIEARQRLVKLYVAWGKPKQAAAYRQSTDASVKARE